MTENDLPLNYVHVCDRGQLLHSVLSRTNAGASLASIAGNISSTVCSGKQKEDHVCFDKYIKNFIKESERKVRRAIDSPYATVLLDQSKSYVKVDQSYLPMEFLRIN